MRASDGIKSNRVVMEKGGGGADGLNGEGGDRRRHSFWCIAQESIQCTSFDRVFKSSFLEVSYFS